MRPVPTRSPLPLALLVLGVFAVMAAVPARCDDIRLRLNELTGRQAIAAANRLPADAPLPSLLNAAPLRLGNPLIGAQIEHEPTDLAWPGVKGNALPAGYVPLQPPYGGRKTVTPDGAPGPDRRFGQ